MLEKRLKLTISLELGGVCEIRLKRLHLGLYVGEPRNAAHGILEQRFALVVGLRVLARPADARRALDYEFALVGRHFSQNDLEERGLSAAVRPHDANPVALVHSEGHIRQDVLMSVVYAYVSEIKHFADGGCGRSL